MKNYSQGFTLIELLVSIAILGIIVVVGGELVISSVQSYTKSHITNILAQNGDFAISTFRNELKNATRITNCTASQITIINSLGANTVYDLAVSDCGTSNNGHFQRGSANLLNTSSTNANVAVLTGSTFICPDVASPDLVAIKLVLAQACGTGTRNSNSATTTLESAVVSRGSFR